MYCSSTYTCNYSLEVDENDKGIIYVRANDTESLLLTTSQDLYNGQQEEAIRSVLVLLVCYNNPNIPCVVGIIPKNIHCLFTADNRPFVANDYVPNDDLLLSGVTGYVFATGTLEDTVYFKPADDDYIVVNSNV